MTDPGIDLHPVRDGDDEISKKRARAAKRPLIEDLDVLEKRAAHQRATIARWTREDLEDKFLRQNEEYILMKKHSRKQEEKIKKLATKVLQLNSEKKKEMKSTGGLKGRDLELEDRMEDMTQKIIELEKQNKHLRDKLLVTKQQLATANSRSTPYNGVTARIDTGLPARDPGLTKNMRVSGPKREQSARAHSPTFRAHSPTLPRYGHSLLEEARSENKHLESVIEQLNEQINIYEQDIEIMKEQMRLKEAEFEDDLLKIKQHSEQGQRAAVQENIDMIRLQREIKERSTKLTQLQGKYNHLEESLRNMKSTHDKVLMELDKVNHHYKQEQSRSLNYQNQLKQHATQQAQMIELDQQIEYMKTENELLKQENRKLTDSAFDIDRETQWRQKENALKIQIAQLEATLNADVGEKGNVLNKLAEERDEREKIEKECSELKIKYFEAKEEADELKEKMQFFSKDSAIDFTEIEEALMIVKQKKMKTDDDLNFLQKVDDEKNRDYSKQLAMIRAEYADSINELEKTRNMLITQHKINKDYQTEVEAVTIKMEENKREYEARLDEYARLLDIRAVRIKKLEAQLRDIAYGTRQYKVHSDQADYDAGSDDELDESIQLERGQNLFEIHIHKCFLSDEALRQLDDDEPTIFCTWEFYEFEIQSTAVKKGARATFDMTSQYIVTVDDFFLHHIQKNSTTLELHQSFGTDYRTIAACQLKFSDIFDKPSGRIHGTATLTSSETGLNYGTIEYWIRLRVPMDQALRLYKERTKALGYHTSNEVATQQALQTMTQREEALDGVNELHIRITRCCKLRARRDHMQPSPYAVYKFFDFPDHDTTIIPNSNDPEFNDHKTFAVPMTIELDKYIKGQKLLIYVFDDNDPDEVAYLGCAHVPLLPLSHDKGAVLGPFQLHQNDGTPNGTIEVNLDWRYQYIPPKSSTRSGRQLLADRPAEKPMSPAMLPGESLNGPQHYPEIRVERQAPEISDDPQIVRPTPIRSGPVPLKDKSRSHDPKPLISPSFEPVPIPQQMEDAIDADVIAPVASAPRYRPADMQHREKENPADVFCNPPSDVSLSGRSASSSVRESPVHLETIDRTKVQPDELIRSLDQQNPSIRLDSVSSPKGKKSVKKDKNLLRVEDEDSGSDTEIEEDIPEEKVKVVPPKITPRKTKVTNLRKPQIINPRMPQATCRPRRMFMRRQPAIAEEIPEDDDNNSVIIHGSGEATPTNVSPRASQRGTPASSKHGSKQTTPVQSRHSTPVSSRHGSVHGTPVHSRSETDDDQSSGKHRLKKLSKKKPQKGDQSESDIEKLEKKERTLRRRGSKRDSESSSRTRESKADDHDSDDIVAGGEATPSAVESDSEGIMMKTPKKKSAAVDKVTILIEELFFVSGAEVLNNDSLKQVFVEYKFLNTAPEETETPYSLPIPNEAEKSLQFNFKKVFYVDYQKHLEARQHLAALLLPDDPDEGKIRFNVVCDPEEEDPDGDCEDVGFVVVDVRELLEYGKDIKEENLDVIDANNEETVIGKLKMTIEIIDALRAVQEEIITE